MSWSQLVMLPLSVAAPAMRTAHEALREGVLPEARVVLRRPDGLHVVGRRRHVEIDPRYFRPAEVDLLIGDYGKAKRKLGWEPKTPLRAGMEKTYAWIAQQFANGANAAVAEVVDVVHRAVAVADVDQRAQHVDDVGGLPVLPDQRPGELVAAAPEVQRERILARNGMTSEKFERIVAGAGAYNDSADCGGWDATPAGDETFSLSAVYDGSRFLVKKGGPVAASPIIAGFISGPELAVVFVRSQSR